MRPVDQLLVEDYKGDCLRACVASLLELDPEVVPNFAECGFFDGLQKWLKERGQRFMWLRMPCSMETLGAVWFGHPKVDGTEEHMLVWGESPRPRKDGTKKQHIVVASPKGYGIEFVHDPHPERTNIVSVDGFGWILNL